MKTVKGLKRVKHDIPNQAGEMETRECVEFIIIGNNHEWKDWMYYEDFKEYNKDVEI